MPTRIIPKSGGEPDYAFPIPDNSYDVVLAGQVIEHVRKIWRWLPELQRLTRPEGHVIIINPITWHYHGFPTDCWRIFPDGMRALCEEAGLEVDISAWENVQVERLRKFFPRWVYRRQVFPQLAGVFGILHRLLRLPFDGSFDTITIARKPIPRKLDCS